jgi:hypothetical protein
MQNVNYYTQKNNSVNAQNFLQSHTKPQIYPSNTHNFFNDNNVKLQKILRIINGIIILSLAQIVKIGCASRASEYFPHIANETWDLHGRTLKIS